MKISSIEVVTDLGRRAVQLTAPIEVEIEHDMPIQFRMLMELLWNVIREIEIAPSYSKVEA